MWVQFGLPDMLIFMTKLSLLGLARLSVAPPTTRPSWVSLTFLPIFFPPRSWAFAQTTLPRMSIFTTMMSLYCP
jgi:hypothetical protein